MDNAIIEGWLTSCKRIQSTANIDEKDVNRVFEASMFGLKMRRIYENGLGLINIDHNRIFSDAPIAIEDGLANPASLIETAINDVVNKFTIFSKPIIELTNMYRRSRRVELYSIGLIPVKELIYSIFQFLPNYRQDIRELVINKTTRIYFVMGRYAIITRHISRKGLGENPLDDANLAVIDMGKTFYSLHVRNDVTFGFGLPHVAFIECADNSIGKKSNAKFGKRYPNAFEGIKVYLSKNATLTYDSYSVKPTKIPRKMIAHPDLVLDNSHWANLAETFCLPLPKQAGETHV